jgi:hypothetical protein
MAVIPGRSFSTGDRYAVGLLFAGDDETTYMNPIATVLDSLDVELIR